TVLRTAKTLRSRATLKVVPTLSFDPSMDEVLRWAKVLAQGRRAVGGLFSRRGEAIRFRLGTDAERRVEMRLVATPRTLRLAAAGRMAETELLTVEPEVTPAHAEGPGFLRGLRKRLPTLSEGTTGQGSSGDEDLGAGTPAGDGGSDHGSDRQGRQVVPTKSAPLLGRRLGLVGAIAEAVSVGRAGAADLESYQGGAEVERKVERRQPSVNDDTPPEGMDARALEQYDIGRGDSTADEAFDVVAPKMHTARQELRLAKKPWVSLSVLDLKVDPLAPFVAAMADAGEDEHLEVIVDLQPLGPWQRRWLHRSAQLHDRSPNTSGMGQGVQTHLFADPLKGGRSPLGKGVGPGSTVSDLERLEDRDADRTVHAKLASPDAAFAAQVLVVATAPTRARARALVGEATGAFAPFAGRNRWRATGCSVGFAHLFGAQSIANRHRFDRRRRSGLFWPKGRSVVIASEIAGLIKPPSVRCPGTNIVRSGGLVPDPPTGLPLWTPDTSGVMPLGWVTERGAKTMRGAPLDSMLFSLNTGRSGYGKTASAEVRLLALAGEPDQPALLYNDPHGDALEHMGPYLLDQADRLVELNLSRPATASQAGWNPLAMRGGAGGDALGPNAIEERTSMIAAAFSSALGWGAANERGMNLITQAAQSLCELNRILPAPCQATIFQIITILADDDWRNEILPSLSPTSQRFWLKLFSRQTGGGEAITPVTNTLTRLLSSRHIAAMFGQSISTFDMRQSMDDGAIILLCPGGVGEDKTDLIHALFLFELFRATLSRRDIPEHRRRACHAFLDEIQVAAGGNSSKSIDAMFQQARKYGLRLHAMLQQPTALPKSTLRAALTNRSMLASTVLAAEDASVIAREWNGTIDPSAIVNQRRYDYLVSITLGAEITTPFRVQGVRAEDIWGVPEGVADGSAAAAIDRAIDRNMARRPVADVLADLDTLDQRILDHLGSIKPDLTPVPPPTTRRRAKVGVAAAPSNVASITRARGTFRPS
ncbi:MAG: hypothetical protein M3256_20200, partial [Actinomycetota bacterium]|nr:hypothetical protein [Actinomycetota bacterium]